jgi:hypothetical protein
MKVKANSVYSFIPALWDIIDPKTTLNYGDNVMVINLPGCPKANTMGCCHVQDMTGKFRGLVSTDSLRKN